MEEYEVIYFNPIPGGGGGAKLPPLSNFFNFLEIGKSREVIWRVLGHPNILH